MKKQLLSSEQAFKAMFAFLDAYEQRMAGTAELADVLADIQLNKTDNRPADPAAWSDWVAAIDAVLHSDTSGRVPAERTIR